MKPISLATLIGMGNHDIEAVIILGQRVIHFFYLAIFDDVHGPANLPSTSRGL